MMQDIGEYCIVCSALLRKQTGDKRTRSLHPNKSEDRQDLLGVRFVTEQTNSCSRCTDMETGFTLVALLRPCFVDDDISLTNQFFTFTKPFQNY